MKFLKNSLLALAMAAVALASPPPQSTQSTFSTPKAAADALIQAAGSYNLPYLLQILGPQGKDLVASQDPTLDHERASQFAEKAREKTSIELNPQDPNRATLLIGSEDWPLPIPIVKSDGKWHFDTTSGRDEVLKRRIGSNELDAISICRGYVEAQKNYASQKHDHSEVNQYAQRIISTPGKHDGLAWKNPDGSWGGPVGHAVAQALQEGYSQQGGPFHGYYFKVLKAQGPAARLGPLNYMIDGAMIGGFALVAWPAQYGVTGIQTFMVSYDGVVLQKDLGPNTAQIASTMDIYNPTKTWKPTNDDWAQLPA